MRKGIGHIKESILSFLEKWFSSSCLRLRSPILRSQLTGVIPWFLLKVPGDTHSWDVTDCPMPGPLSRGCQCCQWTDGAPSSFPWLCLFNHLWRWLSYHQLTQVLNKYLNYNTTRKTFTLIEKSDKRAPEYLFQESKQTHMYLVSIYSSMLRDTLLGSL